MPWRQVPAAPEVLRCPSLLPAWVLGTVPVLLQIRDYDVEGGWVEWALTWAAPLAAVTLFALAVARQVRAWFAIPGLVAVALSWWLLPEGGLELGVVAVTGTLLWGLGLGVVVVLTERLVAGRALWPALAVLVVADVLLVFGPNLRVPAALMGAATLVALSATAAPTAALRVVDAAEPAVVPLAPVGRAIGAVVGRVAEIVGTGLRTVAMVPAALLVTVLWLVHRVVGHDALGSPSGPGTGWVHRRGEDSHPERFYSSTALEDRRSVTTRLSGAAVVVVVLGSVLGAIVVLRNDWTASSDAAPSDAVERTAEAGDAECGEAPDDPVLGVQDDYQLMACERSRAFSSGEYAAPSGYRMSDFDGETLNVVDGVRQTWTPPPCDCPRLRVWWFGGSAAWGEGQRDLYTLPSMVARLAWEEGIALDIENRAMPTWTFGQEAHLFADLLTREESPDLAVFYTGGNDLVFQGLRFLSGDPEDDSDIVLNERQFSDLFSRGIPVRPTEIEWSRASETFEGTLTPELARTLARPAMSRVDRNVELVGLLGEATGTPVEIFLQPLLAGSGPGAAPAGVMAEELVGSFGALVEEARTLVPDGMTDMTEVYVGVDEPVFYDLFHTGEDGAAIMAGEIVATLRPTMLQLVDERSG